MAKPTYEELEAENKELKRQNKRYFWLLGDLCATVGEIIRQKREDMERRIFNKRGYKE